jgi:hypothetical protein
MRPSFRQPPCPSKNPGKTLPLGKISRDVMRETNYKHVHLEGTVEDLNKLNIEQLKKLIEN